MTTELIDLSANNGLVDWDALDTSVAGVVVKLTEGVAYADPLAASHVAGARRIWTRDVLGGYHYLRIRNGRPQDSARQAEQFAAACASYGVEFGALDVERGQNEAASVAEARDAVAQFLARWPEVSPLPLAIYTSTGEWSYWGLGTLAEAASHPLWLASYTLIAHAPAPWSDWTLWQYTGSGRRAGIIGPVDVSRFRGSVDEFRRAIGIS